MTFEELKKKIYLDGKIRFILEQLECKYIKEERNSQLFVCALPNGDNKRSVQIQNTESLSMNIRSKGIKGSIIDLVCYIKDWYINGEYDVIKAKEWLCKICKYNSFSIIEAPDPLDWLHKLRKQREKRKNYIEAPQLKILDKRIMNQYIEMQHINFSLDSISPTTQIEFGVVFDATNDRIVFPIHDLEGCMVGIKGRTVLPEEEYAKRKYLYMYPVYQSFLLYNYHRAINYILEFKEVIVFESEKSCMQAWEMGFRNVVAIGCKDISPYQIQLLKQLNVNVVAAYDKGITLEFVTDKFQRLGIYRNVYAVYDRFDTLKNKQSPTDCGINVWNKLYKEKIKIY